MPIFTYQVQLANTSHSLHHLPPPPPLCSNPKECPHNHIHFFEDKDGKRGELVLLHFKYASTKGVEKLALSPCLAKKFAILEQGRKTLFPNSLNMFTKTDGEMFPAAHMSTKVGNVLTKDLQQRATANTLRHMYASTWLDYIHTMAHAMSNHAIQQLHGAGAAMMQNTPDVWGSYDDSLMDRYYLSAMAHWPKFKEFVKEQHTKLMSRKPWDIHEETVLELLGS